jgi:hypothetical protein
MFEGQLLFKGTSVYSPWFPRRGDILRATGELIKATTNGTLEIHVFTKNSEETTNGDDANVSTHIDFTAGDVAKSATWGPGELEEMVRYKFIASGSADTDWVVFRMLPPSWSDAVSA